MSRPDHSGAQLLLERRKDIDALDAELLRLISERAKIACELAVIKKRNGWSVHDAVRERQVLTRICEENEGPLARESVVNIFCSIIRECRRMEETNMNARELQEEMS